jgi:hypothetical protein
LERTLDEIRLAVIAMKVASATYIPILPIKLATLSSFYCKGVPSSSSSNSFSSTSPV